MLERMRACEAIFDALVDAGLNDESQEFEDLLWAAVDCATFVPKDYKSSLDPLAEAATRLRKPQVEVFTEWLYFVRGCGVDNFVEMFQEVVEKGRKAIDNGISAESGIGAGVDAADPAESAGDAGNAPYGAESGGCAEPDTRQAPAELLGDGGEDTEAQADRTTGTAAIRSESECGAEVGISGEEPGEASDETGSLEGRETCFGSLPPISERSSTYRTQSLCGGAASQIWRY